MITVKAARATVAAIAIAALAGCSTAKAPTVREPVATAETKREGDTIKREEAVTVEATVTAINQKTRMVTLRGADGSETSFHVDDSVKNLPQVRKGDVVTATYYRALAARIRKPGEAKPSITTGGGLETAPLGEKPGGVHAQTMQVTATVTKVDRAKQEVTLRGPRGKSVVVAVQDPANMEKVKKGDLVEITYTEAIAISVAKR
jgi:hypothetical protein